MPLPTELPERGVIDIYGWAIQVATNCWGLNAPPRWHVISALSSRGLWLTNCQRSCEVDFEPKILKQSEVPQELRCLRCRH